MMTELEGKLRDSVRELAETMAAASGESMFDSTKTVEERLFALELSVTSLTQEFSNMTGLLATVVTKMSEHMGIRE
jgi:phage-related minor tail protein